MLIFGNVWACCIIAKSNDLSKTKGKSILSHLWQLGTRFAFEGLQRNRHPISTSQSGKSCTQLNLLSWQTGPLSTVT